MFRATFASKPVFSSRHAAEAIAQLGKPIPPNFGLANTWTNPLGREPGRGFLLMLRSDLDDIALNSLHELIFEFETEAGIITQLKLYNILITQEPINLTPSHVATDPNSLYLVEVADVRWLVQSPIFSIAYWGNFNFTQTWQNVVDGLWSVLGTRLGQVTAPTIPITPAGTPINICFDGESAWIELNRVLAFLGCAIVCDSTQPVDPFTFVEIGAVDTANDAAITALELANRKIHDGEFMSGAVLGRLPGTVRVYFPQHPDRHARDPVFVDVANPNGTVGGNSITVPLYDNMLATHSAAGAVSNQAALDTQAAVRAAQYFKMVETGGGRSWKRFSGIARDLKPGARIKSITWAEQAGVGIYTDVFRNPFLMPEEMGFKRKPEVVRTGYAPVRLWAATLPAYTRTANTITFTANGAQTVDTVATAIKDRVGVNISPAIADNGIWEVDTSGTAGTPEVWKRALDADNSDDFRGGFTVTVSEGGTYKEKVFFLKTDDPIALNTTAIEFVEVSSSGGAASNHNLLSATHPDTVAYSPPVKGDIIAGTDQGGGTFKWARRTVGTNGYVLTADSTQASGLNWSDVGNTVITNLYVTLLALTWNSIDILTLIDGSGNFVVNGTGKSKFRLTYTGGLGSGLGFLGISGGVDGQICYLYNSSSNVLIIKHESTGTAAANRFTCPNGHDYNLWPKSGAIVEWNSVLNRWVFDCQDVGYIQVQVGGINPGYENVLNFQSSNNSIIIEPIDEPTSFRTTINLKAAPVAESGSGKDWWYYVPGQLGRCQVAGMAIQGMFQNTSIVAGRIQALPIPMPRGGTVSKLSIYVAFAGYPGDRVFLGIYRNVSDVDCRPGALIKGGSALIDAVGIASVVIDRALAPGLYWIANFVEGTITGNAVDGTKCYPILGFPSPANVDCYIGWEDSAFGGATLPDPFGLAASPLSNAGNGATPTITAVYVTYSA